ncbi:DUF3822 family protein [Mucilaginibacter terrae]|uniref:DUF3822 family protein n=1 Tax=Mucilaginibacter terrae TaxID=1955052 RepID=A0ABU3GYN2_9SPHI|nr:DUF3822 family protein [Mucilaginibacter terrae]MDT3404711.1 hypothetical protein [Mucilaginibacter terrae]
MNDSLYHYIDPSFSHTQVGNYTLLLQLGMVNFSLAIMHGKQLMVWRHDAHLHELTRHGEVQEVLNFEYQNVITAISSSHFTLLPAEIIEQDGIAGVARFLDVQASDTVFAQPLDTDNEVVFKAAPIQTRGIQRYDMQRVLFGAAGWLQAIAGNHPSGYHLYINVYGEQFDMAYFRQGKLNLFNTFEFTHEDELAYYAVFVCQQLKLDMSTVTVILSGNIAPGDNRYHDILAGIFKTVELNNIVVAQIPDELPKHQLLSLTALTLCASLADA